ncbi:PREDICTED: olfactory receptor 11A1-like [Nanorana parkeri]|uniref:olfactory receptor 11A1-like n=1 Tax=Nanorana parkeri TaxID=125878 RepID=UPI000854805A|nr:PREDICTED: olfactory receptor 11A1-like [Nanorana parkeri]
MHKNNITVVVLLGFQGLHDFNILLFLLLFIIYGLTLLGNMIIISLVSLSKNLHSPMYFFIAQVSIFDILLTTDIVPNMLSIIINEGGTISLQSCIAQFFLFADAEAMECLLLAVMSYDRYLAICNPFHYSALMSPMFCLKSIIFTWLLSFVMTLSDAIATCNLIFCGNNVIDHFFCDFTPLMGLACSDASIVHVQTFLFCIVVIICPFVTIVVSYICIVYTIVRIPSITGRKKAFSTCSSHLTVVCLFYGALLSVYVVPTVGHSLIINKVLALFYTVMTPLLNPVIYSLRNQDFLKAFRNRRHRFNQKF